MALLINQGIQPEEKKMEFAPIQEDNVKLVIKELKLNDYRADTLDVNMQIIAGKNTGRYVKTSVNYNPENPMSWKYRALRLSANQPYTKGEPATIDIEKLLINQVVTADLSVTEGADKDGNPKKYQQVKFKKTVIEDIVAPIEDTSGFDPFPTQPEQQQMDVKNSTQEPQQLKAEDTKEDELPFSPNVQPQNVPAKANNATANDDDEDWA